MEGFWVGFFFDKSASFEVLNDGKARVTVQPLLTVLSKTALIGADLRAESIGFYVLMWFKGTAVGPAVVWSNTQAD